MPKKAKEPLQCSHQFVVCSRHQSRGRFWKSRDFHKIMQSAVGLELGLRFSGLGSHPWAREGGLFVFEKLRQTKHKSSLAEGTRGNRLFRIRVRGRKWTTVWYCRFYVIFLLKSSCSFVLSHGLDCWPTSLNEERDNAFVGVLESWVLGFTERCSKM